MLELLAARGDRPVRLQELEASEALGETIPMGRLDGRDVAYLATRESHEYLRTISRVGRRLPAHVGALGKALLAERPDTDLPDSPYEALTPNTHTTRAPLAADLAEVRSRGYSVDREEQGEDRGDGARGGRGRALALAAREALVYPTWPAPNRR